VGAVRAPFGRNRPNGEPSANDDQILWALKDVCFDVDQGEILGIIGRNGAGKSTLFKILSRITEPTTGRVELHGRVGSLLEVGTGFHPELTGRENIYLNGAILGMKRDEIKRKFDEIVAFAEIDKFLDTPVKRYSSGMYVRLAFAVAAHLESEILIIDEVLAVGDAKFQAKCLGKITDVTRGGGRTVLLVSHSASVVNSLCTKAIYLADGRVVAAGTADDVIKEYYSEGSEEKIRDVRRLRPTGMGSRVRFLDIAISGVDDESVELGEPLEFSLTIESEEDFESLTIGSSIFNILGICVGSLITHDEFSVRAGKLLRLRLTVSNLNLAPGSYNAGFSIGRGRDLGRTDFDRVVGMPSFEVLATSADTGQTTSWYLGWGGVMFNDTRLTIEEFSEAK
jgi:lipopolysaccharide transport system ATP-binding protein